MTIYWYKEKKIRQYQRNSGYNILPFLLSLLIIVELSMASCSRKNKTTIAKSIIPKVVTFNPDTSLYQELFNGDKDSVAFNSGFVTLLPGEAGDLHSTKSNEELIVTFSGTGKVKLKVGDSLDIRYGHIAHIPPNTEHQVVNTGTNNLKYIYITAKSK